MSIEQTKIDIILGGLKHQANDSMFQMGTQP